MGASGTMASAKSEDKYATVSEENKKEMRSFHDGLRLRDDRFPGIHQGIRLALVGDDADHLA